MHQHKTPYLLISKTLWSDVPRIRHQLARLLSANGHPVYFVQKNTLLGSPKHRGTEERIMLLQHGELFHHQLRFLTLLSKLNESYETRQLGRLKDKLNLQDCVVLNFNYDSAHLRTIFPDNQIVTLLHDDYVAGARKWMKKRAEAELTKTLQISNRVLAVSYPLVEQSERLGKTCELFLPWARTPYQQPYNTSCRKDILFWGYFYDNLDFSVFAYLAKKNINLHIVGPAVAKEQLTKLCAHPTINYHGTANLDDIPEIVDRCCCSILPYDPDAYDGTVRAVTISNRAFELLAHGLPLLYANLPALLEAPSEIITKCATPENYFSAYQTAHSNFNAIQPTIQRFLEPHNQESRYSQLVNTH